MEISLSPRRVAAVLAGCATLLLSLHVASEALHHAYDKPLIHDLQLRVSVDEEASLPALFSAVMLLLCLALLLLIARAPATRRKLPWTVLGGAFLFLALDEAVAIHEGLMAHMSPRVGGSGYLHFVWVVPYGIGTAVLAAVYIPFLRSLPRRSARLFVAAGSVFVVGALGFEMLGGKVADSSGYEAFSYTALSTAEETLEMAGVIIFVYALLAFIAAEMPALHLRIGESAGSGSVSAAATATAPAPSGARSAHASPD